MKHECNNCKCRKETAIRLLVGIVSRGEGFISNDLQQDRSIDTAIEMADKLIKQLEESTQNNKNEKQGNTK